MKKLILIKIFSLIALSCFPQKHKYDFSLPGFLNEEIQSNYFATNLYRDRPFSFNNNNIERSILDLTDTNLSNDLSFKEMNYSFNYLSLNSPANDAGSIGKRLIVGAAGGALIGWLCGMLATHGGNDSPVGTWVIAGCVIGAIGVTLFFSF